MRFRPPSGKTVNFSLEDFLKIAHEELAFIRKDLSDEKKIVQVKWNDRTAKWYPIAFNVMLQLMTSEKPCEFATELLLPFTVDSVRNTDDPWVTICKLTPETYALDSYVKKFSFYFSICGNQRFAAAMSGPLGSDLAEGEKIIKGFSLNEIIEAAYFHGDIGESRKTLDETAAKEQALVLREDENIRAQLRTLGREYLEKFGFKFLISAKDKPVEKILHALQTRLKNSRDMELINARGALWDISFKRLNDSDVLGPRRKIESALKRHAVVGAQICVVSNNRIQTLCLGKKSKNQPVTKKTWFELASLSKTLASAFSIQYFQTRGISLDTSVNSLFDRTTSHFRLKTEGHADWPDRVTLRHLMNHTALNMHYVNGTPANQKMPVTPDLLEENNTHGYEPIRVLHEPGTIFQYSGGGFLVLEYLIEALENERIQTLTKPFFEQMGLENLSFAQTTLPSTNYADGFLNDGKEVEGGRKMFPAFAAGAMGTAADLAAFLQKLSDAYNDVSTSSPISHDTAVMMLHASDKGSRNFMGASIGLGIFVAEAGPNRIAIHQGANDGFRSLFMHCFEGPAKGKGLVILCNGDENGVAFVAEAAQIILQELQIEGVDLSKFKTTFDVSNVPQQELVNRGYKELIFSALEHDLPEKILAKGPRDPLAQFNLARGAKILEVSNQGFARAENLLSDHLPTFDPDLYGRQGKVMDSWETVRHNPQGFDYIIFQLQTPSQIHFVSLSTKFHLGNQAQAVMIEGRTKSRWITIVPKTELDGHALKKIKSRDNKTAFSEIRVSMFPDGGLTRLGLYDDTLPAGEKATFLDVEHAKTLAFTDPIPKAHRPLAPRYSATPALIERNWQRLKENLKVDNENLEVDVACAAYGGKIVRASNEHYGSAEHVISPYPPLHMYDGFESARSRDANHFEELVIALGRPSQIHRIDLDFKYFRNNNPREVAVEGLTNEKWLSLVTKTNVKAYAGNAISFKIASEYIFSQVKLTVFPDGGLNRIRVLK